MTAAPKPAFETVRSKVWQGSALALLGVLAFAYARVGVDWFNAWLKPDYSHGFLVPLFSAYLIYRWWPQAPRQVAWPQPWGLAFLAVGMAMFMFAQRTNLAKEWVQGASLVVNLCGVVVLLGGWPALKWSWPAVAFLIFMFPLPYSIEHKLGGTLQVVAARASAFVLQVIGYPTFREGVTLHVKDHVLEVANACSGLSMLLTFAALSTGMAIVIKRPWLDRALILLAAVPVAIFSNVIRIALTGVLYNEGGRELGDRVFHDFAGWMMMPIALVVLWLGLKLLDWVFVPDQETASREDVIRSNASNPAHLFMHEMPEGQVGTPAAKSPPPGVPVPTGKAAPPAPGGAR